MNDENNIPEDSETEKAEEPVKEAKNESEIPLFLRNNPDIAHGDLQDEKDETPE